MKTLLLLLTCHILQAIALAEQPSTEAENAFVKSYRQALESKNEAALREFLLTENSLEEDIAVSLILQSVAGKGKILSIELTTPSAKESEEFMAYHKRPGGYRRLPIKPTQQIVVTTENRSKKRVPWVNRYPVIKRDGRFLIPVVVPVPPGEDVPKDSGGVLSGKQKGAL
jgi:hypothetical protein